MRLIDADRLRDSFLRICTGGGLLGEISQEIIEWAVSLVDDMPTENRWISCSERLPEKHQMVLTTIKGVDLFRECADKNFFEALATAKKRTFVSVGYLGDDGWYGADGFPQIIPTVAWMPLPEPWKGGEEEDGIS